MGPDPRVLGGIWPLAAHSVGEEECPRYRTWSRKTLDVSLTCSCLHGKDRAAEIQGGARSWRFIPCAGVGGKAPHLPRVHIFLPCLPQTPESQQ